MSLANGFHNCAGGIASNPSLRGQPVFCYISAGVVNSVKDQSRRECAQPRVWFVGRASFHKMSVRPLDNPSIAVIPPHSLQSELLQESIPSNPHECGPGQGEQCR